MKIESNYAYEDHSRSTSANTLIARLVGEEDLKGLPGNQVDVLLPGKLVFRAFIEVPFLPLPKDAVEGVLYLTPDGIFSYIQDGEWKVLETGGDEYTIEATKDGWVYKKEGEIVFTYIEPKDHIIVEKDLPTTDIEEGAEYVLLDEEGKFVATYVHSDKGWIQTTTPVNNSIHKFVTELPTVGDEGVEYVLMGDLTDKSTYQGTYVWDYDANEYIQTSATGVEISKLDKNALSMESDGLFASTDGGEI